MLKMLGMPGEFWGEEVVTTVYLLNSAPTQSLDGKTPYEVWHGKKKPSVHHLHTSGCVAYIKESKLHLAKLDACGKKVVFIGYEAGCKAYRVFDLEQNKVHVSRDIVFDENMLWKWDADGLEEQAEHPYTVKYLIKEPEHAAVDAHSDGGSVAPLEEPGAPSPAASPGPAPVVFATPPTVDNNLDADEGA
jgi:hypothetical protein